MKTLPFIGRKSALKKLKSLLQKNSATLAVVKGRRRIGKSRLVEEFAKDLRFLHFSGIAPEKNITAQHQRDVFAKQLGKYCDFPSLHSNDWMDLFSMLADKTKEGRVIILFDEISWLAHDDPTFLPKLKNAWDLELKKNPELILIFCSSISIWIEENILSSTGYFGRIPVEIHLKELPLNDCNELMKVQKFIGNAYEKFQLLSLMGGIPWYLEQIEPGSTADKVIEKLCFQENAVLLNEFDRIFHDLFDSRGKIYKKIINLLAEKHLQSHEIGEALNYTRSGTLSNYLRELITANFITRDSSWSFKSGKLTKLFKYRLSDNYLRFYLKFIESNKEKINRGYFEDVQVTSLPGFYATLGYQFENLVLNNRKKLFELLGVKPLDVLGDNPYFQNQTTRHAACQIDLLIQTRMNNLFVCEIKFSKNPIRSSVINEVEEKIKCLAKPRNFACFPVLIHVNGVEESVLDKNYFYKIISFAELLE